MEASSSSPGPHLDAAALRHLLLDTLEQRGFIDVDFQRREIVQVFINLSGQLHITVRVEGQGGGWLVIGI